MTDYKQLAEEITVLAKLQRIPVGMKFFENGDEARQVPKVRFTEKKHTVCQMISQAVQLGWTVGIAEAMSSIRYCGTINGLYEKNEKFDSGEMLNGVWHSNLEAAGAHNKSLLCMEKKAAIVISPLAAGRIHPDVVLLYGTPGCIFMILCGLINETHRTLNFPFVGESTCSTSWVRTALTREPSLSVCCFAERKFAGVRDDEMLLTLTVEDLERAIRGMKNLSRAGLRYPIHDYAILTDAAGGMPSGYLEDK